MRATIGKLLFSPSSFAFTPHLASLSSSIPLRTTSAACQHPKLSRTGFLTSSLRARQFSSTQRIMSDDLFVELTAPNGVKYTQPTGLFINNEFVKSKSGAKITTVNPTYVSRCHHNINGWLELALTEFLETRVRLHLCTQLELKMSTLPWPLPEKPSKIHRGGTFRQRHAQISYSNLQS